jgi:hypothetical protein
MRRGYGPLFFFFFFFFTRLGGLLLNIYDIDVIAISGMPLFSSDAGGHIDYCRGPSPMVWETVPEGKAGCVKSSRGRYEADGPGWEAAILETGSSLPFFFFSLQGGRGARRLVRTRILWSSLLTDSPFLSHHAKRWAHGTMSSQKGERERGGESSERLCDLWPL